VRVIPVPRAALLTPDEQFGPGAVFGSGPNVYTLTAKGERLLRDRGLVVGSIHIPNLGVKHALLFMSHRLFVGDIRIWLEQSEHELVRWHQGDGAAIDLQRSRAPNVIRPDAWMVCQINARSLVAMIEADRNTEKGGAHWKAKLAAYQALFSGPRLQAVTGFQHARLLVVTTGVARRSYLADFIATHGTPAVQARTWLADHSVLQGQSLSEPHWQRPGSNLLQPLIPKGTARE